MKKGKKLGFLTSNWKAKIGSTLLAALLIILNRSLLLEDRIYTVPLNVLLHNSMVLGEQVQPSIRILIRAEGRKISGVRNEDFRTTVDFSSIEAPGTYSRRIIVQRIDDALALDPVELQVDPPELNVSLERKLRKSVPVESTIIGFPATGYKLVSATLNPAIIQIEGPESLVSSISSLGTSEISMTERRSSIVQRVRVEHENPLISFPSGSLVEFRATIEETPILNTFEAIDIVVIDLNENLRITRPLPAAAVRVQARVETIEKLTLGDVQVTVDASRITESGTYSLATEVQLPEGVNLLGVEPERVDVVVDSGG